MTVRHSLLAILAIEPCHGYQLKQEFELRTGGSWPISVSQVYSTLDRLLRDGLVAKPAGDDAEQARFEITAAGRDEVSSWLETPVIEAAGSARNELASKLALAMTLPSVDVHQIIQGQRRAVIQNLQELNRLKRASRASLEHSELSWQLVVDSLTVSGEAQVRWLDHTEARLTRLQADHVDTSFGLSRDRPKRGRPRNDASAGVHKEQSETQR